MSDETSSLKNMFFNRIFVVGMFILVTGFYSIYEIYSFKRSVNELTHAVIVENDYDKSSELLQRNEDLKVVNEAFHRIIWNYPQDSIHQKLQIFEKFMLLFLDHGADPGYGLYFAALSGNLGAIRYLLNQDITAEDIHNALPPATQKIETFEIFLEAEDLDKSLAMEVAALYNQYEGVKMLIDKGVDINSKGLNLLYIASKNPETLQVLLDNGINPYEGKNLYTLRQAAMGGCVECVRTLLDYGFNVKTINKVTYKYVKDKGYHEILALIDQASRTQNDTQ